MTEKLFVGPRVRRLREQRGWKIEVCAARLGISTSYLSQLETNVRPVTARVLLALLKVFDVDAATLDADDDQRLLADLREAAADPLDTGPAPSLIELKQMVTHAPNLARRFLAVHRTYRKTDERLKLTEAAVGLDGSAQARAQLPYEEVRDFFHNKDNYLHDLDLAAERLSARIGFAGRESVERTLERYLREALGVETNRDVEGAVMRRYDPAARRLSLNPALPVESRAFQMACHIVGAELGELIGAELAAADLRSRGAGDICRLSLINYAAGAVLLPYAAFRTAAQLRRHDIDQLSLEFQCSIEQVCHRLSTLQRPGERGVPFYFVRLDPAGNITKRHSATRFHFARFGGTCPLWNIHEAFRGDGAALAQLAEMPDGVRYLCMARSVLKPATSSADPPRRYALGLGCEVQYADAVVYADRLNLAGPPALIGVSCRICERDACQHRAFPPVDRQFDVPQLDRSTVPFALQPIGRGGVDAEG
ncbi:MAG TPA: short-chain fatty acyl-CoA regulator family protein [Caulobacteraceae bacterium]